MAKKKILVVPQNGTQPATYPAPTPIDNLISGGGAIAQMATNQTSSTPTTPKRVASFYIDRALVAKFKAKCAQQETTMSELIESFMRDYISK